MSAELEEQIAQLENSLGQEQQRLEKLWDAYEQQEKQCFCINFVPNAEKNLKF